MNKGQQIIESIKGAIAGDFARVTTHGQTWVRLDTVNSIEGYIRAIVRDEMIRCNVLKEVEPD